MQFLNHPITISCFAITLIFILPVAFLRVITWLCDSHKDTLYPESRENQHSPDKEYFPNGCEIMLKAARGELPRTEYNEFCQQREKMKMERIAKDGKTQIVKNYSIQRKNRRFGSPTGW